MSCDHLRPLHMIGDAWLSLFWRCVAETAWGTECLTLSQGKRVFEDAET